MGTYIALAFSAIAVLVLIIGALVKFTHASGVRTGTPAELLGMGAVAIVGYVMAGLIGGAAIWALRPIRRWLVGWLLNGVVVACVAYGSIGLLGAILYQGTGINLFDYASPAEAWRDLPGMIIGIGLTVGIPGGAYFWWKRPWG